MALLLSAVLMLSPVSLAAADPVEGEEATGGQDAVYYRLSEVPENIRSLIGTTAETDDRRLIKVTDTYESREALENSLYTLEVVDPVDGTGKVMILGAPVKYIDDDGEIRDTSLKSTGGFRSFFTGYVYENEANAFRVRYAASAYQGYSVDGLFQLSVREDGSPAAQNAVVEQQENGAGTVRYAGAFGPGTTLEYINTEGGVKENIVLGENVGKNRFEFTFRSAGYHPVLSDDRRYVTVVSNDDPDRVVYQYNSLFAYDSYIPSTDGVPEEVVPSGFRHLNEDCWYDLVQEGDGTYTIAAVVPEEYLNHPETVYPVIIDPTMTSSNSTIKDAYTYGGAPNTNYGNADFIRVGITTSGDYRGFICFDGFYDAVSYFSYVTDATIQLTYRSGQTTGPELIASMVTSSWSNGGITRNNEPAYWTGGIYGTLTKNSSGYYDKMIFSVTNMARLWHNSDDYENMGIKMSYAHFSYDTNTLVSSNGDAARSPAMFISYRTIKRVPEIENNGVYYLRNRQNGQYLDLPWSSTADGTKAQTDSLGYDDALCWQISGDSGYYLIRSMKDTGRYAVLGGGGNCSPGTEADLYGKDSRTNYYGVYMTHSAQLWDIVPRGNGYYRITPKRNMSLALSVAASGQSVTGNPRVTVEVMDDDDYRQQWYFEKKCVSGKDYKLNFTQNPGYATDSIPVNINGNHKPEIFKAINGWNTGSIVSIPSTQM
ncbi:MAG: DNRLRE domain-containing protein [Clostridiales bacterium]|nr:DNRLRE domain-containing protein [Clostridiales bacterium]